MELAPFIVMHCHEVGGLEHPPVAPAQLPPLRTYAVSWSQVQVPVGEEGPEEAEGPEGLEEPPPQLLSELQKLPYALRKAEHVVTPLNALVDMLGQRLVYEESPPEETSSEASAVQTASPAEPRLPNWLCIV